MAHDDSPLDEKTKIALGASQELRIKILLEAQNLCIPLQTRNSLRIVFDDYDEELIKRWEQKEYIRRALELDRMSHMDGS